MVEELPKQELLIKLLRMTTSPNDGEALVAIRKATKLMDAAGWTWDKLIHSRITVIGDPFKGLGDPGFNKAQVAPQPAAATNLHSHATAPQYRPPPPPPPPQPTIRTTHPIGHAANKYEGACYCCGKLVAVSGGFLFKPSEHHSRAGSVLKVICTTCNTTATIGPYPAPRVGPGARKVTADDLA